MKTSCVKRFSTTGLVGLSIGLTLNLVALLVLKRHSAEFFSTGWWSTWFPSYAVWLVFAIAGLGARLRG